MFTGIIEGLGRIKNIEPVAGDIRLHVEAGSLDMSDVQLGDSIAVNGVCLTAIEFDNKHFVADVSNETMALTSLKDLATGSEVNLEKALLPTTRLGGHLVSGHVDGLGEVLVIKEASRSIQIIIRAPDELKYYIAMKGSICIDGTSLTVNKITNNDFEIKGMKTLWTLRNDDNYYFRWGAPGFLREFIKNIPYEVSEGFYYGSDGYVWGREFLSKNPKTPRELEIEKHWYHWMTFGRLGYNPDLPDQRFVDILQNHFPEIDGKLLFDAWQEASMIYPVTTGFHWGAADFSWYIEGCISHPAGSFDRLGIHHVEQFIKQKVHAGTNNQSIPDYVEMVMAGETSELTSPLEISGQLHNHADKALELINSLGSVENAELSNTLADIRSISYLGKYYAHKINGATHLALYRKTKNKEDQAKAVEKLDMALVFWRKYTENAMKQYINPIWMKRVGMVDWVKFTDHVKNDIEIAKQH